MPDNDALKSLDPNLTNLLVENHRRFLSFISKRVGSETVAEDLLQSSLKKALESPPRSTEEMSVVAWFYRVLRNTLIDHYRSKAAEDRKHDEFSSAHAGDVERAVDDLEAGVCACMDSLLPTLKESYAELIRRIDLGSEPIAKVAQELGVTENNLSVRLHRARQALKTSLERTCGTCTEHGCLNCTC